MDHLGMDVHKKDSQLCILTEAGELIERRVRSEPERFVAVLGDWPRARSAVNIMAILGRAERGRGRRSCRTRTGGGSYLVIPHLP